MTTPDQFLNAIEAIEDRHPAALAVARDVDLPFMQVAHQFWFVELVAKELASRRRARGRGVPNEFPVWGR